MCKNMITGNLFLRAGLSHLSSSFRFSTAPGSFQEVTQKLPQGVRHYTDAEAILCLKYFLFSNKYLELQYYLYLAFKPGDSGFFCTLPSADSNRVPPFKKKKVQLCFLFIIHETLRVLCTYVHIVLQHS